MVAVNNVALLAFSLASLSLSPSADAAAVRARSSPSDPGSPSKSSRQPASPLPMRMKRMVLESPGKRERAFDAMPKRLQKSRVVEVDTPLRKAFLKRKQDQATFHVSRRHVEARQDSSAASVPAGDQGRVDLMRGNTTVGHLVLNESNTPPTLDASNATATDSKTTLYLVRSESADASYCTLEMPASSNSTGPSCATFDPYPSQDEPLTMQPCFGNSTAPTARSTSLSQTFSYDPSTGFIAPVWDNSSSADNLDSRDTPESVTLVFVPTPSAGAAEANDRDSQSASLIATETVTTTVTATAIPSSSVDNGSSATDASSSDASTPSPALAAAQVDPSSSTDSLSQPTSSSSPTDSSISPASSSAAPTMGALAVEVAPAASSSVVSSVLSSDSSAPSASPYSTAPSAPMDDAMESDPTPSDSMMAGPSSWASSTDTDSSVPSATSTADAGDSSGSASTTTSPSSSPSPTDVDGPLASDEQAQAVYVENARGASTPQWR